MFQHKSTGEKKIVYGIKMIHDLKNRQNRSMPKEFYGGVLTDNAGKFANVKVSDARVL